MKLMLRCLWESLNFKPEMINCTTSHCDRLQCISLSSPCDAFGRIVTSDFSAAAPNNSCSEAIRYVDAWSFRKFLVLQNYVSKIKYKSGIVNPMFAGQVGVLWTGCLRWKTTLEWIGSTRTSGFYSVAIVQCTSCNIPKHLNQALPQVSIENSI